METERLTVHKDGAVKIKWSERLVQKDENGRFLRLSHPGGWISQKASFVDVLPEAQAVQLATSFPVLFSGILQNPGSRFAHI